MIIGEIKRFLRDDGILKVSRSVKENQYQHRAKKRRAGKRHWERTDAWRTGGECADAAGRTGNDHGCGK